MHSAVSLTTLACALCLTSPAEETAFLPGVRLESAGKPIDALTGHLVPCVVDWNGDGKKDLLVGQFNDGCIRLFLNQGTDSAPVFSAGVEMVAGDQPIRLDAG